MRDMMRKGMGNGACPMCGQTPCACEGESESEMEGGEEEGYESSEGEGESEDEGEMDVEALKQEAISVLFHKGTDDMLKKEIAQALADGDWEHVSMLLADSKGPMKKSKGIAVMIGVK
jgi:hypothetical protein